MAARQKRPAAPGAGREAAGVEKAPTGIEGFDEITAGGLPRGRTTLLVGGSGCGKTVFALQTLVHGAREHGEPGVFIAFEENTRQIVANASTFGWDLPALEREKLFFLDARLSPATVKTGEFDLAGLLASVEAKAADMGARRVVFDSVDVLLAVLNDATAERREMYRLHDWLSQSGLTGIVTSRLEGADPGRPDRYSFMQFMADCVVGLQQRIYERVSLRDLRVMKYRGSGFAENEFPMVIGPRGIEVAGITRADLDYEVSDERVSSGVPRLDTMLGGGYFRGASVLITGLPGTAKSTLSGAFAEAACLRGERTLMLSFDEPGSEIVRNLSSVGIDLAPHVKFGTLVMRSALTESRSAEEHLMVMRGYFREFRPRCVVIDPLSAILKAGGDTSALSVAERLLQLTKREGITVVCTGLAERQPIALETASLPISTFADTWIHLSYVIQGGERNRALTIVKSRGTKHSNQVRELVLDDDGVTLTDVYAAGGEVLMGTQRWEREEEERLAAERRRIDLERRRGELESSAADLAARADALNREIEARRAELELLRREEESRERERIAARDELRRRRGADEGGPAAPPAGKARRPGRKGGRSR